MRCPSVQEDRCRFDASEGRGTFGRVRGRARGCSEVCSCPRCRSPRSRKHRARTTGATHLIGGAIGVPLSDAPFGDTRSIELSPRPGAGLALVCRVGRRFRIGPLLEVQHLDRMLLAYGLASLGVEWKRPGGDTWLRDIAHGADHDRARVAALSARPRPTPVSASCKEGITDSTLRRIVELRPRPAGRFPRAPTLQKPRRGDAEGIAATPRHGAASSLPQPGSRRPRAVRDDGWSPRASGSVPGYTRVRDPSRAPEPGPEESTKR